MPESTSKKPNPILLVLAVGLIFYFGMNISTTLLNSLQNQQRLQDVQHQVAQLQAKRDQLQQTLEYEQSERFVEQTARNELDMARPNETVVIFPRQQDVLGASTQAPATIPAASAGNTNFQKWAEFFIKDR